MKFTKRQIDILEVSKDLIGTKGIQNLTIKNIAKKMSFSEPACYRHFKDKTEILKSLLVFHKELLSHGIHKIIKSDKTSLEKIRSVIEFQFDHLQRNPDIIMVIFSETSFQYNNLLSNLVAKVMRQRHKKLTSIIKDGQEKDIIRQDISANQIATIIMGSMRLTVLKWKLNNFDTNLKKEGREIWKTIEKLIKK